MPARLDFPITCGASTSRLDLGQSLVFQQQYDWWGDLYDGPHPFKVGKVDFNFTNHFYNKLSKKDKKRWWDSKVRQQTRPQGEVWRQGVHVALPHLTPLQRQRHVQE
jgi:hypothetical protein